ncbi:MAG: FMN-binding protein [Planctomycetota bacterium]
MNANMHTLIYAAALGVACAALLTGAGLITAPYREANEQAEEVRNILSVLGVPFDNRAPSQELVDAFDRSVRREVREELTLYVYVEQEGGGAVRAVALPVAGQGVWGPIRGLLALESDMETIRGVTFYDQEETPGLGGEIASDWFQEQFKGKLIRTPEGEVGIRVRQNADRSASNEVDAITGATMTSERIETILNAAIEQIVGEEAPSVQ